MSRWMAKGVAFGSFSMAFDTRSIACMVLGHSLRLHP